MANNGKALEIDGSGEAVRQIIAENWPKYEIWLRGHLMRAFGNFHWLHDSIISDGVADILRDAEKIEGRYRTDNRDQLSFEGYFWSCLKRATDCVAMDEARKNSPQKRIYGGPRNDEDEDYQPKMPIPVSAAQQEEIVFLKQLIERLAKWPMPELEYLRTIVDLATVSELCRQIPIVSEWMKTLRYGNQDEIAGALAHMKKVRRELGTAD